MHVAATKVIPAEPLRVDDEGTYSLREVSRLFEVPEHRLRYWSQTGFLVPSLRRGERRAYSFRDLIAVKMAKGLLDGGLPLRRVRRQLEALRATLPRVQAPLHDLRIRCEHDRVIVDEVAHRFEAGSGQLVLDFEVSALRDQAAQVLALPWVSDDDEGAGRPRTAYEWFLFAQELEDEWGGAAPDGAEDGSSGGPPWSSPDGAEDGSSGGPPWSSPDGAEDGSSGGPPWSSPDGAEDLLRVRHAYEAALELDPGLAAAWTNLGSLLARMGELEEAAEHFEQALAHDPEQEAARLNLAALALQLDRMADAAAGYREVLRRDPDCIEAHYGLARVLLQQGGKGEALAHLERFRTAVDRMPPDERDPELSARREQAQTVIGTLRRELGR